MDSSYKYSQSLASCRDWSRKKGLPCPTFPGVLCDDHIRERLHASPPHRLVIEPFSDYGSSRPDQISFGLTSGGYDIRLGHNFLVFTNTAGCLVDPKRFSAESFTRVHVPQVGGTCVIPPNCFALAESIEYVEIPSDCMTLVLDKSTYARVGINLPFTPLEPAWRGRITIEIINSTPLPAVVYAGEGIAQLLFLTLSAVPRRTYADKPNARYQDQKGLTPPRGIFHEPGSHRE